MTSLPCILRAWNNYHGFSKYTELLESLDSSSNVCSPLLWRGELTEPASDHQNTLDYFYTLVPEGFATVTIPSAYFHIATQQKWLDRTSCTALFVVNGAHIYLVKKQSDGGWRRYDWPHADLYENVHALERSIHHTLYVVLLYPAENHEKLKGCFVDWVPKRTEFYLAFKRKLMAAVAKPPFV